MANDPVVVIEGADALAREFRRIADKDLQKMLRIANKKSADVVVQKALPNVPVGATGRLKASVRATGSQRFGEARAGNAQVAYAAAIHWGRGNLNTNFKTGKYAKAQRGGPIKGRPFLTDAADGSVDAVTAIYTVEIGKVLATIQSKAV